MAIQQQVFCPDCQKNVPCDKHGRALCIHGHCPENTTEHQDDRDNSFIPPQEKFKDQDTYDRYMGL